MNVDSETQRNCRGLCSVIQRNLTMDEGKEKRLESVTFLFPQPLLLTPDVPSPGQERHPQAAKCEGLETESSVPSLPGKQVTKLPVKPTLALL